MKRYGLCALLCCLLAGCGSSAGDEISDALGISVPNAAILTQSDSHGGFFGDGVTFLAAEITDAETQAEITENWTPLPLSDTLTALAYGRETAEGQVGPFLSEDGAPLFPAIQNGSYFFLDRHSEHTAGEDEAAVLERASLNFTLAIYDADTQTLYYAAMDT